MSLINSSVDFTDSNCSDSVNKISFLKKKRKSKNLKKSKFLSKKNTVAKSKAIHDPRVINTSLILSKSETPVFNFQPKQVTDDNSDKSGSRCSSLFGGEQIYGILKDGK